MNKNKVVLCGKITDPFEIAFVMGGYTYLKTRMTIKRYSQYEDVIPLIIRQDLLLKNNCEYRNKFFEVKGSFNSKNRAVQIAIQNGHLCHVRRSVCDIIGGQPKTN